LGIPGVSAARGTAQYLWDLARGQRQQDDAADAARGILFGQEQR
jgi:hypothetical protein